MKKSKSSKWLAFTASNFPFQYIFILFCQPNTGNLKEVENFDKLIIIMIILLDTRYNCIYILVYTIWQLN